MVNLGNPTRLGAASVIALGSALIIFLTVEVSLMVLEDLGYLIEMPYIILFVLIMGVLISLAILAVLARQKFVYTRWEKTN